MNGYYYIAIPYLAVLFSMMFLSFPLMRSGYKGLTHSYNISREFALLALMIFFFAFRGYIFGDWHNYYDFYNRIPTFSDGFKRVNDFLNIIGWEKGFVVYAIICKTISDNYLFLQVISSIIDILILFYFFKLYIPKHIAIGFIFFFLFSGLNIEFNLLRNSKATMLFLISIRYIEKKRFLSYLFFNGIGILFHISSILYIPVYFILNRKYAKKLILCIFVIGNIVFLAQFQWIRQLLDFLGSFIGTRLGTLLQFYSAQTDSRVGGSYGISIGYIERTCTFFLLFILYNRLIQKNKANIIFYNMLYLYLFIFLYCSEITVIPERVAFLFICSYWILYPQIYGIIERQKKKVFMVLLLFYGSLKMVQGNLFIDHIYDNILLGHRPYNERMLIIQQSNQEQQNTQGKKK